MQNGLTVRLTSLIKKQFWTDEESSLNFIFSTVKFEDDFSTFRKIYHKSVMTKYFNKLAKPSGYS